jgi:hypothetical protein
MLDAVDVIVDLGQDPQGRGELLLETLLALDEGWPCHYTVRLDQRRLAPKVQSLLIDFMVRKNASIDDSLPNIVFPQELLDVDPSDVAGRIFPRIATATKRNWFERNLSLLKAIESYEEFIYLLPDSAPLRHGWVSEIIKDGRASKLPILAHPRKLLVKKGRLLCGWYTMGWFNGKLLRKLPLRSLFSKRLPNPWADLGCFQSQRNGPGYCLASHWLSGFDTPADYLLFALYGSNVIGSGPEKWADTLDIEISDLALSGIQTQQVANLRRNYFLNAQADLPPGRPPLFDNFVKLPLSGPEFHLIGRNQVRFEIDDLHNLFAGERCVLIGNGPSLRHTNLSLVKEEYTIGLNRIYLNYDKMGFQTTFLCVTNPNVITQFAGEIDVLNSIKFLRYQCRDLIRNRWNTYFMESSGFHEFFHDLRCLTWCEGCTVTYCAMQVAFYLGFEEVVLVGVDHRFSDSGRPHQLVTSDNADKNHFHPNYFGKGIKWQYPDLAGSEVSYKVANEVYKRHGRRIVDATVGGDLKVFPKVDYMKMFG